LSLYGMGGGGGISSFGGRGGKGVRRCPSAGERKSVATRTRIVEDNMQNLKLCKGPLQPRRRVRNCRRAIFPCLHDLSKICGPRTHGDHEGGLPVKSVQVKIERVAIWSTRPHSNIHGIGCWSEEQGRPGLNER